MLTGRSPSKPSMGGRRRFDASPAFKVERITTFGNDRTLWTEQPMYTQFALAVDRMKALANARGWTVVDMSETGKRSSLASKAVGRGEADGRHGSARYGCPTFI